MSSARRECVGWSSTAVVGGGITVLHCEAREIRQRCITQVSRLPMVFDFRWCGVMSWFLAGHLSRPFSMRNCMKNHHRFPLPASSHAGDDHNGECGHQDVWAIRVRRASTLSDIGICPVALPCSRTAVTIVQAQMLFENNSNQQSLGNEHVSCTSPTQSPFLPTFAFIIISLHTCTSSMTVVAIAINNTCPHHHAYSHKVACVIPDTSHNCVDGEIGIEISYNTR